MMPTPTLSTQQPTVLTNVEHFRFLVYKFPHTTRNTTAKSSFVSKDIEKVIGRELKMFSDLKNVTEAVVSD
jgi:hypothetical protein